MTIEERDRESMIQYRLEQAEETILDVKLLIENGRLRSSVNRIDHQMGNWLTMSNFFPA